MNPDEVKSEFPTPPGQDVICAKCETRNRAGEQFCGKCGAHLYLFCAKCGAINERVAHRCVRCQHRLHHAVWKRIARLWADNAMGVSPLHLMLMGLVLLVILIVILKFVQSLF